MPKYYQAKELVTLLDGAVTFWSRPDDEASSASVDDESRYLLQPVENLPYYKTSEGLEISIRGGSSYEQYQKAHELARYLHTRSFSRKLNAGEDGMTKKIIRPRILMTKRQGENGFDYSVLIPNTYKNHLERFASRGMYKRWRATFLNAAAVRWTQRIFSNILGFLQAPFLSEFTFDPWTGKLVPTNFAEGFSAEQCDHLAQKIYIPTENGSVLQGFETTLNAQDDNTPETAVLVAHGNGEYAAHYVQRSDGRDSESNLGIDYFRRHVVQGNKPTTVQFIDLPGYGLSTGLSRRLKDIEDAYFDAAKQLVDRGYANVKLVARSLSGFPMPEVALRLQKYVKENNKKTTVTLYCDRTGRSVFGVVVGKILNLFLEPKIRSLDTKWRKSGFNESVAKAADQKYKRILEQPLLSLNPLQWIGFGLLSAIAFVFVYPLAVITGWERNSVRTLSKLEKGSVEFFNGKSDNVISRVGLAFGAVFKTRRKIKQLKTKLAVLENKVAPADEILNEIKHKRLKLWQLETRRMTGPYGFTNLDEKNEHNDSLSKMKTKVTRCDGEKKLEMHASMKFRLFYRLTEGVYPLKREHREHKRQHFGIFKPKDKPKRHAEFVQYQANKKARHAESAKIADEFFPGMKWRP